jgi:hypothetical protein
MPVRVCATGMADRRLKVVAVSLSQFLRAGEAYWFQILAPAFEDLVCMNGANFLAMSGASALSNTFVILWVSECPASIRRIGP